MKANDWLVKATKQLEQAGIGTARLDALVLLEDITGVDRAKLLAEPGLEISASQAKKLKNLFSQRAQHIPLAYIRGITEFYGREFLITPAVLEPRPESETIIDLLKNLSGLPAQPRIGDVGTGSGALGITAKLELPEARLELIEIDPEALEVVKTNVDKFTLEIPVIESDLLATTTTAYEVLLCNLPYVPDDYRINTAALHEPRLAIFGGPDGLDVYRKLFKQLAPRPIKPLYILSESLPWEHAKLKAIAQSAGYRMAQEIDFIQLFKRTQKLAA